MQRREAFYPKAIEKMSPDLLSSALTTGKYSTPGSEGKNPGIQITPPHPVNQLQEVRFSNCGPKWVVVGCMVLALPPHSQLINSFKSDKPIEWSLAMSFSSNKQL